jgi:hypothetical protein
MKRQIQYYFSLILFTLMTMIPGGMLFGQASQDEKVLLQTDRNLYITGENIWFSAFLMVSGAEDNQSGKVLYCELISPDGNKLSAGKFPLNGQKSSACLFIPEDAITGYYYLRAYTRWMRNEGPSAYSYTLLKIINPSNPSVLNGHKTDSLTTFFQKSTQPAPGAFDMKTDKWIYVYRDSVKLSIAHNTNGQEEVAGYVLSVVPEKSFIDQSPVPPLQQDFKPLKHYYPETRGLSLTGNLSELKDGKPSPANHVSLVIIGKGRDFMSATTDKKGDFYFSLPAYTGSRDLLLSADSKNRDSLKLKIDNDFCPLQLTLPIPPFKLTDEERSTALQMAANVKLANIFPYDTLALPEYNNQYDNPFYGKPDEVLVLENYIQLTSLEEYFNELALYAKVRKAKGGRYFKVIGPNADLNKYEPLILVDWVAIDDPEKILAISPQNVSRLEIINQVYCKGGVFYGGIVSIVSRNGDFAGIELPSSSVFINYKFLSECQDFRISADKNPNHPDTRNTLLWEPDFMLQSGEVNTVCFTTSDNPGAYLAVLKVLYKNGSVLTQTHKFMVGR